MHDNFFSLNCFQSKNQLSMLNLIRDLKVAIYIFIDPTCRISDHGRISKLEVNGLVDALAVQFPTPPNIL